MVVVGDISIIHACILKFKSNIHQRNIITLHYTGNKFLQPGLEGKNIQPWLTMQPLTIQFIMQPSKMLS